MFSPSHFSALLQVQLPAIHAPCLRFAGNSARLTLRADDREGPQRRYGENGGMGNMGKSWENHAQHGKTMGKSWKTWENHENIVKLLGKPWENHGKFMDLIMTNTWIPFNKMADFTFNCGEFVGFNGI